MMEVPVRPIMQEALTILMPQFTHEGFHELQPHTAIERVEELHAPPIKKIVLLPALLNSLLAFAVKKPRGQAADPLARSYPKEVIARSVSVEVQVRSRAAQGTIHRARETATMDSNVIHEIIE
jgi:hypothetical protein